MTLGPLATIEIQHFLSGQISPPVEKVSTHHQPSSSFSNLTVNHRYIFVVLGQPFVDIMAEWPHLSKFWWVVIVKGVDGDPAVKFTNVIRPLTTEIVDLVMISVLELK